MNSRGVRQLSMVVSAVLFCGATTARAQQSQFPSVSQSQQPSTRIGPDSRPGVLPDIDPPRGRIEEQQAKSRNADRQKRLVSDTNKLLSLATELKEQVDKTDKYTLSLDVVKKADEIEKLARSVKDRMKG